MKEYRREYPLFSLCGLNCGLCPRFQSEGASRCPGCGGKDFHLQHPSCAAITCSKKHGEVEYCFLCGSYPCERYKYPSERDSFITHRNVTRDMQKAMSIGIEQYKEELSRKTSLLERLISDFNDGRRKNFYCLAVNLLDLADLTDIEAYVWKHADDQTVPQKDKIVRIESLFRERAHSKNLELTLRK